MAKWFYFLLCCFSVSALADGVVVDKVYHPYVTADEKALEWRFLSSETPDSNRLAQRIGYGFSLSEAMTLETYIVAERDVQDDFTLQALEAELKWMFTEQGQYWADWGFLFEVEAAERNNARNYEVTTGLLFEKEIERNSLTMNLFIVQEWGESIPTEIEAEFRLQYRYRYKASIQPAIELYTGERFVGIGPAIIGLHRFDGRKQLKWELGFISEIAHQGKDHSVRMALEFEF